MISSPSRLNDDHQILILDASVAINLLATARPADVLRLLGRKVIVDELALQEVIQDPSSKRSGRLAFDELRDDGLVNYGRLSDAGYATFLELTGASPPDDLDDGEAATIAHAIDIMAVPVIDERKAIRISRVRNPGMVVLHTLDLLACPEVIAGLPNIEIGDLVYNTLQSARMRVQELFYQWVVTTLGSDHAANCPSLSRRNFGRI